jgi:lipoprotein-anchoring transpeptidase ErfK/SrfK
MEIGKIKETVKKAAWDFRWVPKRYLRVRGTGSPRRVSLYLASVLVIVLFIGLLGVLLVQDVAVSRHIFEGVKIDGKNVGGLSEGEALALISKQVAPPLAQPVVLTRGSREYKLDLGSIAFSVDYAKMANQAYWVGRSQFIFARMFRRLMGKPLRVNVPVSFKYDLAALKGFVNGVAGKVDYSPQSARIDVSSGSPIIVAEKDGVTVKKDQAVEAVIKALPTPTRRIAIPFEYVHPQLTTKDIGRIIVISLKQHELYLYDRENEEATYLVAVGMPQYPTPTGEFHITYKEKNPTWLPTSEWALDKRGIPQPPGPNNPLGGYWMDLGGGVGIHATPFEKSLGEDASHGCIRMSKEGAAELFDRVKVGTPVFIIP